MLLLHGVRSDRREMLDRARFLKAAGFSVLLIDLPAHGESSGSRITFGAREANGVNAALGYLKTQLPGEKLGVIGVSLGAASFVLANPPHAINAAVIESMYPTIAEAVEDRLAMRLGAIGTRLAPLLLWQLPLRTGVTVEQQRPIAAIRGVKVLLLIASGLQDRHTTFDETKRIYQAANEPKSLWGVEGADHVDLHAHDRRAYEAKTLGHFAKYLPSDPSTAFR